MAQRGRRPRASARCYKAAILQRLPIPENPARPGFLFCRAIWSAKKIFSATLQTISEHKAPNLAERAVRVQRGFMKHNLRGAKPHDDGQNPEQRLLDELYRQRTELGEIAAELISLLESAGVSTTNGPDNRSVGNPPE